MVCKQLYPLNVHWMISYRIGISGGDVNSIYLPESKTCFAWLILTISSELIHFGNGVFKFHKPNLTLLFQGIIPHLLMRVVKKIFKDHNCHMSLNYNWNVIYNFKKPNSRKTKVICTSVHRGT
jgi:hypothetical protein